MLNLNLNILGASNKPIVGISPAPEPTTTTTTTTTTTSTTTTTTTSGPGTVRTDPYSASLVYAAPMSQFTSLGMTSFREDISQIIRGTGTGYGVLPTTGSGVITTYSASAFSGYATSLQLSGSTNGGAIAGSDTNIQFPTESFTIEAWINWQTASIAGVAGNNDVVPYIQYGDGVGFGAQAIADTKPGMRFLAITSGGTDVYLDSNSISRDANKFYHTAYQRSGSQFSSLFDGKCLQSFTLAATLKTGSSAFQILHRADDSVNTVRYQDYRIYKGVPKYGSLPSGSTYTVPESMIIA